MHVKKKKFLIIFFLYYKDEYFGFNFIRKSSKFIELLIRRER
jgi:hypothetical protein